MKSSYVLFGALAMLFYCYIRTTEDLDIAVNPDGDNLDRVAEWLMSLKATLKLNPARRFGAREPWGLHKRANATVLMPLVSVLNRQTLIDLKRRRGSNLDLADIDEIEQLAEL